MLEIKNYIGGKYWPLKANSFTSITKHSRVSCHLNNLIQLFDTLAPINGNLFVSKTFDKERVALVA